MGAEQVRKGGVPWTVPFKLMVLKLQGWFWDMGIFTTQFLILSTPRSCCWLFFFFFFTAFLSLRVDQ